MFKKLLKITVVLLALALVAGLLVSRFTGVAVVLASGEHIGYAPATKEWLLVEYPNVPARRDGPYVLHQGATRTALTVEPRAGATPRVSSVPVTTQVQVVVDDAAGTRFSVPLRAHHPRAQLRWPEVTRWLAVSDLEGEFTAGVALLRAQGVIDEHLDWTFGDGHLVLVGDLVDRGDNVVPLLWLVYRLEAQAQAAGGAVHYVLGNHERYVLQGRPKSAHAKYLATSRVTGVRYGALWSRDSELGRWLHSKPVLVQVGDTLFAHGGIAPHVLERQLDLAAIDALAERHVAQLQPAADGTGRVVIQDRDGVLAYRGLAQRATEPAPASAEHVTRVLQRYGVKRLAVGHTLVEHVGHSHGGRVLRTDVLHAKGVNEGILWADGRLWRVDARGTRLPLGAATNLD